jgi:hypothetical protein
VDRLVQGGVLVYLLVPTVCPLQCLVDLVDALDPDGVEPLFEGLRTLGGVDLDAVLPGVGRIGTLSRIQIDDPFAVG